MVTTNAKHWTESTGAAAGAFAKTSTGRDDDEPVKIKVSKTDAGAATDSRYLPYFRFMT